MRFIRGGNEEAVSAISEYFQPGPNHEGALNALLGSLQQEANNTYLYLAFSEDAAELAGFAVAYANPGADFVTLVQIWSGEKFPDLADRLFFNVIMWAGSMNRSSLRMETAGDTTNITERWGFEILSITKSFNLVGDWQNKLFDSLLGRKNHGTLREHIRGRSEDEQHPQLATEGDQPAAERLPEREGGNNGDTLQRTDSAGVDQPVWEPFGKSGELSKSVESVSEPTELSSEQLAKREAGVSAGSFSQSEILSELRKSSNVEGLSADDASSD